MAALLCSASGTPQNSGSLGNLRCNPGSSLMETIKSREACKRNLISAENPSGQKELPVSRFKREGIAVGLQHAKWTCSILVILLKPVVP